MGISEGRQERNRKGTGKEQERNRKGTGKEQERNRKGGSGVGICFSTRIVRIWS
jgi:hypothetical protein